MKISKWLFCLLPLILFIISGCATGPNWVQGWAPVTKENGDCPFHESICADYKSYIDKLTPEQKTAGLLVNFYADGNGRHAVRISMVWKFGRMGDNTYDHVLFYDKTNKRFKVIKYTTGSYMS